jgi:hypothetical protein
VTVLASAARVVHNLYPYPRKYRKHSFHIVTMGFLDWFSKDGAATVFLEGLPLLGYVVSAGQAIAGNSVSRCLSSRAYCLYLHLTLQ